VRDPSTPEGRAPVPAFFAWPARSPSTVLPIDPVQPDASSVPKTRVTSRVAWKNAHFRGPIRL
jgi:hypothetical protein